jgi:hypothetical protein
LISFTPSLLSSSSSMLDLLAPPPSCPSRTQTSKRRFLPSSLPRRPGLPSPSSSSLTRGAGAMGRAVAGGGEG